MRTEQKKPEKSNGTYSITKVLHHYFFISYLIVLFLCLGFLRNVDFTNAETDFFSVSVYVTYSLIYLVHSIIITYAITLLRIWKLFRSSRLLIYFIFTVAAITTAATDMLLFTDEKIFKMFGFHFNGFVWNLLTTNGGVESMGIDSSTHVSIALFAGVFVFMQSILLIGLNRLLSNNTNALITRGEYRLRRCYPILLICLLILSISEHLIFGINYFRGYTPVLEAAEKFPFYISTTFTSFAKKIGVTRIKNNEIEFNMRSITLEYPLKKLTVKPLLHPMNVVWLVSESWRTDVLTPEIMPATYTFATHAHRFTNHYSGGNGTRMGVFSMFYGMYGSYWFNFLNTRRPPVIMDLMQHENYQFDMFTSAKFTYPEFDRTVFSHIPNDLLHQSGGKGGFINDRNNVSELIKFVENHDKKRPFMTFMFFESPHFPYTFPKECIIRKQYLPYINHATVDVSKDIGLIRNRYINAVHHLDTQFKRIFEFLEKEKLLGNTIVIVTGDHGEEFMEKGYWGHGSTFDQEQIRTPLILWIPNSGEGTHNFMTSHMDIVPTITPYLGLKNDPEDFCLGHDLLGTKKTKYTVVASWGDIAIIDDKYKYVTPVKDTAIPLSYLFTKDDKKITNQHTFFQERRHVLMDVMANLGRFLIK